MTPRAGARRRRSGSEPTFAVISGGGTGGHVSPALAIGEALVARGHPAEAICFVGARRGIERTLVPEAGFPVILLPGRGIVRRLTWSNLSSALGIAAACVMALGVVARLRPAVVLTVGGYAGFPAALAAIVLRIPLVAVHIDAVPGAANRVVSRQAAANAVSFPGTAVPRATVTGPPIRAGVLEASSQPDAGGDARKALGLSPERLFVLATGGSLGAASINRAVVDFCAESLDDEVTVYHVCGQRNLAETLQRARAAGLSPGDQEAEAASSGAGTAVQKGTGLDYRLVGFERKLPSLLAACDVAIARAGASTVAELASIGVASVLVPLPGAPGDHQSHNAEAMHTAGAAVVIPDRECTGERLRQVLEPLLADPVRREAMAAAARTLGHRDAADRVAALAELVAAVRAAR